MAKGLGVDSHGDLFVTTDETVFRIPLSGPLDF